MVDWHICGVAVVLNQQSLQLKVSSNESMTVEKSSQSLWPLSLSPSLRMAQLHFEAINSNIAH